MADTATAHVVARLICPLCGDDYIAFNSCNWIAVNGTFEPVAILSCSDSHAFCVPYKTLRAARIGRPAIPGWQSRTEFHAKVRDSLARAEREVTRARRSVEKSQLLRIEAVEVLQKVRGGPIERPCGLPIQ